TELNNLGFEIQRATGNNKLNWVRIGFVEGNGTSTDINNYTFNDDNPLAGTSYYRLKQIDYDGTFRIYDEVQVDFNGVTDYALEQNYPNPFNPSTTIRYSIPVAGKVELTLYNLLGSEVAVLVNEQQEAGNHSVQFSTEDLGTSLGSGIYFYTLKSGGFTKTRKMIVLK
ncbi:MAG: T9SS type A sorting domain-containing protein, partial [Candidatus Neomarinimicrobiota bacterium]